MSTTPYPDWPWHRVRYELAEKGKTLADVARSIGLTKVSAAAINRLPNPKMQAAIASVIGVSPIAIWPSRYTADGKPVRRADWLRERGMDYEGRPLPAPAEQAAA